MQKRIIFGILVFCLGFSNLMSTDLGVSLWTEELDAKAQLQEILQKVAADRARRVKK